MAGICPAAFAQGKAAQAALFEEHEIRREGIVARYVTYGDQLYRRVKADDLKSLALGNTPLQGLRVCVEGKFDRLIGANTFRIMGSDRQFWVVDRQMVGRIMPGDNVWIGGQAERLAKDPSCYLKVHYVVRLPRDTDLFDQRFAKYVKQGDWERLLELADWIELSSKLAAGVRLENVRRYRVLKDKATRAALKIREKSLDSNDAESWYQLALMYLDRLGRPARLTATECLRRAYTADGGHEKTKELLNELGYVVFEGKWIGKDEYEEIQRERTRLLALEQEQRRRKGVQKEAGGTTAVGTGVRPEGLSLKERSSRLLEIEREVRGNPRSLIGVAERLSREDDAVARRVVWLLANTGDPRQIRGWELLLENLASLGAPVRRDVADALASREQLDNLDEMIRNERDPKVSAHAVEALASVDPPGSVDKLISLSSFEDKGTRSRVNAALRRLTGQSFFSPDAWSGWWEDNKKTFGAPARSGP